MLWTWTWKTTHLYFTHWHCHWVRSYKFSPPFNTTLWSDKIKKDLADCFLLWKPFRSNEIAFKRIPYHAHLLNLHETTSAKCSQTSRSRLHRSFPILGPSITVTSCFWRQGFYFQIPSQTLRLWREPLCLCECLLPPLVLTWPVQAR